MLNLLHFLLQAPVVISRDHHDVSGTDSPFRETSNITDGSAYTADMAVQNCIGDAFRGATWVALHNGGGVGWGDVINGGFGMVLDGSEVSSKVATIEAEIPLKECQRIPIKRPSLSNDVGRGVPTVLRTDRLVARVGKKHLKTYVDWHEISHSR